jgi:hypothetical protein
MKPTFIFGLIFAVAIGLAAAGEVTLSLKQIEGLEFSCSLTNASQKQVYVAPFYIMEQFYAQPNCSDCATGWVSTRPMVIGEAKDFIPLASGTAIKFDAIGCPDPRLPWRVSCFAVTNSISVTDKNAKPQGRIVIQSAQMPARFPSR